MARHAMGQRPSMSKIRGYVGVWLSAEELIRLRDALDTIDKPGRRSRGLNLRERIAIAATWAQKAGG